jgi:hypothetical protein
MDNWGQGTFTLCVSRLYRRAIGVANNRYTFVVASAKGWGFGASVCVFRAEQPFHPIQCHICQIPPDLVVKSQTIDITGDVLSLIRRPKGVQTLHRNRTSRLELLFLSEAHRSTTKSDGM